MSKNKIEQKWLNSQQAADYLGISRSTLYHWVNERKIEYHKLSLAGRLRFLRKDLDNFMFHCSELGDELEWIRIDLGMSPAKRGYPQQYLNSIQARILDLSANRSAEIESGRHSRIKTCYLRIDHHFEKISNETSQKLLLNIFLRPRTKPILCVSRGRLRKRMPFLIPYETKPP